jgi:hypothetical protein
MSRAWLGSFAFVCLVACGARSSLLGPTDEVDRAAGGGGPTGAGGSGGEGGEGGEGGGPPEPCGGVPQEPCGSDVGVCSPGVRTCQPDGFFGPCEGAVGPFEETCNALDDDCDGQTDEGFGLGQACDGPDSDLCLDDVLTCDGCSLGPDAVEVCNGVDDNCNGIIDSDCEQGGCSPTLLVTGSEPSNPGCIDFPVEAGSTGVIQYPCEGGPVTATLGAIEFTGSVQDGVVSLFGTAQLIGPDGCLWQTDHFIDGTIASGTVQYFYDEILLTEPPDGCWSPCTETGTVDIDWLR